MTKNQISFDELQLQIGNRLKDFVRKSGLSQKEFCDRINFNQSSLSGVVNGKIGISMDLMHKLYHEFDIDFNWLIKGDVSNSATQAMPKLKDPFALEEKVKLLEEQLAMKDEIIKLLKEKIEK